MLHCVEWVTVNWRGSIGHEPFTTLEQGKISSTGRCEWL